MMSRARLRERRASATMHTRMVRYFREPAVCRARVQCLRPALAAGLAGAWAWSEERLRNRLQDVAVHRPTV